MLTPKQQRFIKKWERKRVNKRKYCLLNALYYGGIYTIIIALVHVFVDKEPINLALFRNYLITFVVFIILSYFFLGERDFKLFEERYQRVLESEKEEEIEDPIIGDEWKMESN